MSSTGPLATLRIIDLTGDLGRYGTKVLAEAGATVWRPAGRGSSGRTLPGRAGAFGGVLDWWFDSAKQRIDLDLDTVTGRDGYRRLAAAADVVIESERPGRLADLGVDHADLTADNPGLVQVSVTPFGRTGSRAGWAASDLVAGALGGVLSLTGTEDEPLNSWGWQGYNFAGFVAALSALAGVRHARRHGRGQLVDISLHEVVSANIENLIMQYEYDRELEGLPTLAPRQGSRHWLGAYTVVPAASGSVMVTPTPSTESLIEWMLEHGVDEARPYQGAAPEEVLGAIDDVMATVRGFAARLDAGELFTEAQRRHVAFGEVQTVAQVADNPQFAHRALFGDIDLGDGERVRGPWRQVRYEATPTSAPSNPDPSARSVAEVLAAVATSDRAAVDGGARGRADGAGRDVGTEAAATEPPLAGLRVVDLSWVLAGPSATRLLGDLGADVIKVQTEERATLVNQPEYPYYQVWNRSKRSATLDLKRPGALDHLRRLVEQADVLVENYAAGVLDRLGVGWDQVREWNPRLVYISMSGCGHDGPWSGVISYAPTIHALCGLTHLTNPEGRGDVGCGFSLNDHAAGFSAVVAVLAALHERETSGRGQHIDMAQLEIGAGLIGPALIEYFATGSGPVARGNVDGLADQVPNEVYRCVDGRHLAVTAVDDEAWCRLATVIGWTGDDLGAVEERRARRADIDAAVAAWAASREAEAAMTTLQEVGVAAGVVQNAADLLEHDPQHRDRGFWITTDTVGFGPRRHDRFPGHWSDSELGPYRPAPAYLGEANFEVWGDLAGLAPDAVAEGMAEGLFS